MPGFALEQTVVKRRQISIGQPLAKDAESLAGTGLDQPGHEQPVDGFLRLLLGNEFIELAAVVARSEAAKADSAALEQVEHHAEMVKFLDDDGGQLAAQLDAIDVGEDQ